MSDLKGRPRVAHVITRLIVGGAQENTLASVVELRRRGRFAADLVLGPTFGPEGSLVSEAHAHGVEPCLVSSLRREVNPVLDPIAVLSLVRVFRRGEYDVVHTHSSKAGILARLAARIVRVPVVVHTVHGWGFNDRQWPVVRATYIFLERRCAAFTDALITVTPRDAERGLSLGIGRPDLYTTIRSGIDLARFEFPVRSREDMRAELRLENDDRVVMSIMRLSPQKAPLDLIEAAALLIRDVPNARIVIVGDGPMRTAVEARRTALKLDDHVVLTGLRRDVPDLLRAADVLGVVARIEIEPPRSQLPALHRPIAYESGQPMAVIAFSTLHATTASTVRPPGVLARRPSPMIDLYRKKAFSTRAC